MKQRISLSSYTGKKYRFKGPTKLASKHFCQHHWRATVFQVKEISGRQKRHECTRCGMVEMR